MFQPRAQRNNDSFSSGFSKVKCFLNKSHGDVDWTVAEKSIFHKKFQFFK